jgi:hypothetical protein
MPSAERNTLTKRLLQQHRMFHLPPQVPPLAPGWVACQSPDGRTFYHNPQTGASDWDAPSPPPAPFGLLPSAPPLTASHASFDAVGADPELQLLTDALVALNIGVRKTCAALAAALEQKGVMRIDDVRLLPEAEARDLLERSGFEKIQQLKLMQAVAPPPAAASRDMAEVTGRPKDEASGTVQRPKKGASHAAPMAEDMVEVARRPKDEASGTVRKGASHAAAMPLFPSIPSLSLRTNDQVVSSDNMLRWNTAVPGVSHPDVFAFDVCNASVVRVRVRGVYQLHVAVVLQSGGVGVSAKLDIFVNGTLRCSGRYSFNTDMGHPSSTLPMIVFDILQLEAGDSITVRPEAYWNRETKIPCSNNTCENRLNLVLLQCL